ncbi:hypothetical protein ACONE9_003641, partial [Edwardsiella piscicida]
RFDAARDKRASFDALFLRGLTRTYLISGFFYIITGEIGSGDTAYGAELWIAAQTREQHRFLQI